MKTKKSKDEAKPEIKNNYSAFIDNPINTDIAEYIIFPERAVKDA